MVDKLPMISEVHFEQTPERTKIVLPTKRQWPFLILYSVLMLSWLVMMVWGVVYLIEILFSDMGRRFLFGIIILLLLLILFRFGRFLRRQWAHFMSNREILFINNEELIVRRPISIWGNTDVYAMEHVTHVYESEGPRALAFDYGYRHIYFGEGIGPESRQSLRHFLNQTYFPDYEE